AYETECPGDSLEALLPGLRGDVWWNMGQVTPTPRGQITEVAFPGYVPVGQVALVQFTVKNTGSGVMVSQSPGPGGSVLYNEGSTYESLGYSSIDGCWRVGIDYAGNSTGRDHPF